MATTSRYATLPPAAITRDRVKPASWTRTVVVIRIPRFRLFGARVDRAREFEDPLAAFAAEDEMPPPVRRRVR